MEQKQLILNLLSQILQDNLGNRMTFALANGILAHLDQELTKAISIEKAKADGRYFDMPDAVLVKTTEENPPNRG